MVSQLLNEEWKMANKQFLICKFYSVQDSGELNTIIYKNIG